MSEHKYLFFDQLIAELQSENNRRLEGVESTAAQTLAFSGFNTVNFDTFSAAQPQPRLVPPAKPDVSQIEVGSRITLLSVSNPEFAGSYDCHLMIVFKVMHDELLGYVLCISDQTYSNRCEIVSKAQTIEHYAPLGAHEKEVWSPYDDDIPF